MDNNRVEEYFKESDAISAHDVTYNDDVDDLILVERDIETIDLAALEPDAAGEVTPRTLQHQLHMQEQTKKSPLKGAKSKRRHSDTTINESQHNVKIRRKERSTSLQGHIQLQAESDAKGSSYNSQVNDVKQNEDILNKSKEIEAKDSKDALDYANKLKTANIQVNEVINVNSEIGSVKIVAKVEVDVAPNNVENNDRINFDLQANNEQTAKTEQREIDNGTKNLDKSSSLSLLAHLDPTVCEIKCEAKIIFSDNDDSKAIDDCIDRGNDGNLKTENKSGAKSIKDEKMMDVDVDNNLADDKYRNGSLLDSRTLDSQAYSPIRNEGLKEFSVGKDSIETVLSGLKTEIQGKDDDISHEKTRSFEDDDTKQDIVPKNSKFGLSFAEENDDSDNKHFEKLFIDEIKPFEYSDENNQVCNKDTDLIDANDEDSTKNKINEVNDSSNDIKCKIENVSIEICDVVGENDGNKEYTSGNIGGEPVLVMTIHPLKICSSNPEQLNAHQLSVAPPIRVADFVQGKDPTNIQVLCVDLSRALWQLSGQYLVTTERRLAGRAPSYWTLAPDYCCRLLVLLDETNAPTSSPTTGQANSNLNNFFRGSNEHANTVTTNDAASSITRRTSGRLKVKSFAKIQEENTSPASLKAPVEFVSDDKLFRKLTDDPLVYAQVWSVVSDAEECRGLVRAGAALALYCRRRGMLLPLLRAWLGAGAAGTPRVGLSCPDAPQAVTELVQLLGPSINKTQDITTTKQKRTAYDYPMDDKPDDPMDLVDLPLPPRNNAPFRNHAAPKSSAQRQREYRQRIAASRTSLLLPSRSNAPVETQDAAASTSATLFAEPPTIAAPKSKAQKQRENRQRIAASRTSLLLPSRSNAPVETQDAAASTSATPFAEPQKIAAPKSGAQRQREYRLRIAASRTSLPLPLRNNAPVEMQDDAASTSATLFAEPPTIAAPKSKAQKQREYRLRIAASRISLPLPLRNNAPIEMQDDAASTSATLFAEPPTIAAPKSSAQRAREYRERVAASRTPAKSTAARISETERKRNYRLRIAANLAFASGSLESTTIAAPKSNAQRNREYRERIAASRTPNLALASGSLESTTIAAPKSSAQRAREYRERIAASRTPAQSTATRISEAERKRNYRLRKAANLALASGSLESTTASSSLAAEPAQTIVQPGNSSVRIEVQRQQSTWNTKWQSSIMRFTSTFLDNDFGYACSVCDRLWFKNDLKPITAAQLNVISDWLAKENRQICREEYELICSTCKRSLNKKSIPPLAKVNGFSYPDRPQDLPPLDPISERLISPRLPFMQVRRLRHDDSYGIIGQAINVPVDVQEMVKCLPRQLNEDDVINVNIKRNLAYKSNYISRYMSKTTIKAWLDVLQKSPLYRLYKINVDLSRLNPTVPLLDDIQDDPSNRIENISENTPESEILASRQHTMMWNEEDCLHNAQHHDTRHHAKPLNIIYDCHAEELSFPSIYFGVPRRFNMGVSVTHYMTANSEIRRRDRRGATPQKILYVAMKILRLRMVNGIYNSFRNVSVTGDVTRRMLEDTEFLKEHVIQNLAFMKTVPNSVQYWASCKRDLFAMIRQLGKPTMFLSISANEIRWMNLLTILLRLSNKYPGKTAKDLNTSQRCTLVSDDPVTCCIYFYRLVGSLMKMLKSKQSYNPFGQYSVKDYFLRIEFQHSGSPHAHILLWLNNDPQETVSENMPRTIELVEKLSSVARDDVPNDSIYANQIHKHTFTCTKRGDTTCRFGIPYWPMSTTRVLVPMPQSDTRRKTLQQKAKELRTSLGERRYTCMDDFLKANNLTYDSYLDVVRSTLRRPTLLFRRNFDELMTNTFNPYIAGEVNSYIDIQFILDEFSCAEYVVEYVNKSARGMSNLRRDLTTMMQEHPEQDYTGQLKTLSIKLLNAVEMSAQEAAWYLLRQPMSETSRYVVYIPTVWPAERQRCRKRRLQMDREGIDGDSTNVWTKNIIQRYEERPASLEQVYLAEFASWYANANDFVDEEDDMPVDDDDSEGVPEARTLKAPKEYRRRLTGRVIRYRRYNIDETLDYKREMVLLYVQFRNEISEIVDQNKFLQLFDDNKDTIMERRSLFETNLNIESVTKELEASMTLQNEDNSDLQEEESKTAFVQRLSGEDGAENADDVNQIEEAKQCDVKAEVLQACTNHQSETTGDHP